MAGLEGANSSEVDPETPHPVIDSAARPAEIEDKGATMRLGAYPCVLEEGTRATRPTASAEISERHRHRYEFNNDYRERKLSPAAGLVFSGMSPDGRLAEVVELPDHPFFVACQFHPEFKPRSPSTPTRSSRPSSAAATHQRGRPKAELRAGRARRLRAGRPAELPPGPCNLRPGSLKTAFAWGVSSVG